MWGALTLLGIGLGRGRRASLAIVLIVLTIAAAGLAAGASVARSSSARIDESFVENNGADLVVYAGVETTHRTVELLDEDPDVVTVAHPIEALEADVVTTETNPIANSLRVTPSASEIGAPVLRSGRFATSAGEVALDAGIAVDQHIAIGDTVAFDIEGSPIEFVVVGTAYDFSDCFYPSCDPGRSWVDAAGLARAGAPTGSVISVRTASPEVAELVEERLVASLGSEGEGVGANTWLDTRGDLLAETQFFAAFLGVFGLFVVIASGVVIVAALAARTLAQRRNIGLYKAVGGTPRQISAALMIEHLLVAAVASVVGWFAADVLAPQLRIGAFRVLSPNGLSLELTDLLFTFVPLALVVAAVTVVPAWRAGRVPAIDSIRDASARPIRSHAIGSLIAGVVAPAPVELGVRNWFVRRLRSVSVVVAVAIAIVAGVVSLSMGHAMDRLLDHPELTGDPWDIAVTPKSNDDRQQLEAALGSSADVVSWFTTSDDRATLDGERLHVRAIGGDPAAAGYAIGGGRSMSQPGEAIIGYGTVDEFGLAIGDEVQLIIKGAPLDLTIVGWYRETEDSGQIVQIRDEDYVRIVPDRSVTYNIETAPGVSPAKLAARLRAAGADVVVNEADASQLEPFRIAMTIMTAIVVAVALAHLFGTTVITARERNKTLATLRSIGYSRSQTIVDTATTAGLSLVIACVLATPIGVLLAQALGDIITSAVGAGPGVSPPTQSMSVAALAICVCLLALAATTIATLATTRKSAAGMTRSE